MVSRFKTCDNEGHRGAGPNRPFHCGCCAPPRQIYYRLERPVDRAYHEADHTPAEVAISLAARRRMLRER